MNLIGGVDSAGVSLIQDGEFRSTATTSDLDPAIDQQQLRTGEGPCLDASSSAVRIRYYGLRDDPRWPQFARAAVAAGVHSVMSFQLFTHGANTGALNLFGFAARAFDPSLQVLTVRFIVVRLMHPLPS